MKNKQHKAITFFEWVTSYYKILLSLSLLLFIGIAIFIPKMTKDTRYDAFLPKNDEVLKYRNQVKETFGLKDPMVIAVVNEGTQGVFTKETLELVYELTEQLKTVPGVDPDQITSLATENNIIGTEDGILVTPFFEIEELTPQKAKEVAKAIADFELYQGSLVSKDQSTTLIIAEMLDSYNMKQHEVYSSITEMLETYTSREEALYLAGEGAVSGYLIKYIDADAMRTNPFAGLVIALILIFAYRTVRGVVIPNLMVLASVGIALGAMAAFGVDFYVITNGLPVVLIAIAVADGIHILGEYYEVAAKYPKYTRQELIVHTMDTMWRPITITSITTITGFLSVVVSSYMPPMQFFGLFGALGVGIALLYAVFMIPSALMLVPPQTSVAYRNDRGVDGYGKFMKQIGKVVVGNPKKIIALSIVVIGLGISGAIRLVVNEDRVKNFQKDEPIVIADAVINEKTDGTSYLDIFIETPNPEDIFKPENLRKMETFQTYMETLPHVEGSISIVDFVKKMNQSMHNNDPLQYTIPEDQRLIAQYFLLYSASGDPTDFDPYVDYDYRLANIRFRMNSGEYLNEQPVVDQAKTYIDQHFRDEELKATPSGKVAVDAYWINRLGHNHFLGAGIALFVVLIVAAFSFRSWTAGVFTIIPVFISVLFIYTVMGIFEIWLAVGTSMFAAIAIGVGVDFAVHTVDRLQYFLKEKQLPLEEAYTAFYSTGGRALLFNLLALAFGFSVLLTSSVPPLSQFGLLVAVAVIVSFIASITLLPALMYVVKPKFLKP